MSSPTTTVTTHALRAPDVTLHYEVRGSGPLLVILGAPMDASDFAPLAERLADSYTVVTTDPRGISHSVLDDPEQDSTPVERARDVHRILTELDRGPALVFGSSGGAVTGLALAATHPEQVHTLVAHEPPVPPVLPDAGDIIAGADAIRETFLRDGQGPAWRMFMELAGFVMPEGDGEEFAQMPEPDETAEANGAYMLGHMLAQGLSYCPDVEALRAASTRIVIAVGDATTPDQLCHRTSATLAGRLGTGLVGFPGDHGGFLGAPEAFEQRLRDVLAG